MPNAINILDIILLVIIGFFLVRGIFRGLIVELGAVAGVIGGYFLADKYVYLLEPHVRNLLGTHQWTSIVAFLAIFLGVMVLATLAAKILSNFLSPLAPWLNSLLGGAVGFLKGCLVALVVIFLFQRFMPQADFLARSSLAPQLREMTSFMLKHVNIPPALQDAIPPAASAPSADDAADL